jgi:hypothetical protein
MRGIRRYRVRRRVDYQFRRWVFVAVTLLAALGFLLHSL